MSSLWFDVESKYEATGIVESVIKSELWFDVESKYEATHTSMAETKMGCGLM